MAKIYLFEAGGTKTSLLIQDGETITEFTFPGFNPNRYSDEFEIELKKQIQLEENASVYFYGSGLVEEDNKKIVKELFYNLYKVKVIVYDDVTGAARAAFGDKPGLIAIMGTGGVVAYYDGQYIVERNGGYGYLIDDYGGGLELGKIIISTWLNGNLPDQLNKEIKEFLKSDRTNFIINFYRDIDLKQLAGVVELITPYLSLPEIKSLVDDYFAIFFKRHVIFLVDKYDCQNLSIVGSIGFYFKDSIQKIATSKGVNLNKLIDKPAHLLLAFHR